MQDDVLIDYEISWKRRFAIGSPRKKSSLFLWFSFSFLYLGIKTQKIMYKPHSNSLFLLFWLQYNEPIRQIVWALDDDDDFDEEFEDDEDFDDEDDQEWEDDYDEEDLEDLFDEENVDDFDEDFDDEDDFDDDDDFDDEGDWEEEEDGDYYR